MKAELLAMLAVKGVDINKVPGGIPEITQMDVAAMLRKCTPCEEALLRAMYVGESASPAFAYWAAVVLDQNWGSGLAGRFARATLDEIMSNLLCRNCGGLGQILEQTKMVPCPAGCLGGKRAWSNRTMATELGFKSKLHEPWVSRVEWGRSELRRWHDRSVSKLRF